jgi:hypothetical protein
MGPARGRHVRAPPVCVCVSYAAADSGDLWAWGLNFMTVFGLPGTHLRVATKLPVPRGAAAVDKAQLGCRGDHFSGQTRSCFLWVLLGEYPWPRA